MVIVTVSDCRLPVATEAWMSVFNRFYGEAAWPAQEKGSAIATKTILLATDFSAEARKALRCAISLAKRFKSRLVLTHVLPAEGVMMAESGPLMRDALRHDAEKSMAKLERAAELRLLPHEAVIRPGDSWDVISQVIQDKHADLVVMGTHGRGGIKKLILGSTAEKVIRHAACPVLTVGPHVPSGSCEQFGHIFYASDFSSGSHKALPYAISLAEKDRSHLTLLHVIESDPSSQSEVLERRKESREKLSQMVSCELDLPHQPELEVELGIPQEEIVRQAHARKANLIIMGAHAGGIMSRHLPWTTLYYVLQHAHCPVLTVRGEMAPSQ